MARCENCNYFDVNNALQGCTHPYVELNPFGFEMSVDIDCDTFENIAYSHESVVDMVVHEDIEMLIFGGR